MTGYIVFVAVIFALSFSLMIYFSKSIAFKLFTVAILFILSNMIYFSFDSIKGWPTSESLPKRGQMLWAVVNEPTEDDPGAIYLWIIYKRDDPAWYLQMITYDPPSASPRAFKIKYSKKTATKIQKAKSAMEQGFGVEVSLEEAEGEGNSTENKNKSSKESNTSSGERGSAVDEMVPTFKLIDPREQMGKVQ